MYNIIFIKDARTYSVTITKFWELARAGYFAQSDMILNPATGRFFVAGSYPELQPYLPRYDKGAELIAGVIKIAAVIAVLGLVINAFDSPQPSRRGRRRPRPNREPLEAWKKNFVRERDDSQCQYCGGYAQKGHVDHKTSRANGGNNWLNNLCWACAPCNLSKGRRNAPEFRRSFRL